MMLDKVLYINNITKPYKNSKNPFKRIYRVYIESKIIDCLDRITGKISANYSYNFSEYKIDSELFHSIMQFALCVDKDSFSIIEHNTNLIEYVCTPKLNIENWDSISILYHRSDSNQQYEIILKGKNTCIHKIYYNDISLYSVNIKDDFAESAIVYLVATIVYAINQFIKKEIV